MKTSLLALTVAAAVGLSSVPAFARDHEGDRHEVRREGHDRHWDRGGVVVQPAYYPQAAYYPQPGYYPQAYYGQRAYRYDSGDAVGAAIAGAVIGGLVTQMALHHR
ncbi:hypothetical protein [Ramlibacter sp.]|uniref:hypothetical protein n=1 Tax=Ramlibacter sp. TaxID=1917967 RepID=UPI002625488D|nr:hypothetical protein [Ramlibacter sp.]MDB5958194.1 hypothetical protein [Ramlibacter sp.]